VKVCQLSDVCRTLFVYLLVIKTRTEIPWNRDSIPDTDKNCLLSTASKLVLESDVSSIPGIKRYIHEADLSPPSDRRWAAVPVLNTELSASQKDQWELPRDTSEPTGTGL